MKHYHEFVESINEAKATARGKMHMPQRRTISTKEACDGGR